MPSIPTQPPELRDIIKRAGGPAHVAFLCGLHHATVIYWREIPLQHVLTIAKARGLRPSELRPELAELFALEQEPQRAA